MNPLGFEEKRVRGEKGEGLLGPREEGSVDVGTDFSALLSV